MPGWYRCDRWKNQLVILLVAAFVLSACAQASDGVCPAIGRPPRVGEAATAQSLDGVVESQTIASNPLPWGRSVEAVTRVWGDVTVERLVISDRRFVVCPEIPATSVDQVRYRFVGLVIGGADDEIRSTSPLSVAETAPLDDNLGPAVSYSVSGGDRLVSSLLVWSWEITGAVAVAAASAWLIAATRRRRRDRRNYLF